MHAAQEQGVTNNWASMIRVFHEHGHAKPSPSNSRWPMSFAGRDHMLKPRPPGRYGPGSARSITSCKPRNRKPSSPVDRAVWRHGYVARVTQDVDIVLAVTRLIPSFKPLQLPDSRPSFVGTGALAETAAQGNGHHDRHPSRG